VPRDRFFDTCRSILSFFELTLVPIGPRGYELYLVIDSRSTNNYVRNKAEYVDYADIDDYRDRDGLYISCAIPVRFIENLTMLRTALATMVSPGGLGRVQEVPGSQSIIIMDFAPTVWAMAALVRQMDISPPGKRLVMEFVELEHAYAVDVAEILGELVAAQRLAQQQPIQRGQPGVAGGPETPEPRILAYEPKNALAIFATEDDYNLILGLIKRFDTEGEPVSTVDVVRLNHVRAEDVADTLTQVLEGMGGFLGEGAQPQAGGQPRQPGVRRTGGRSEDFEPQVVPDAATNTLILAADRKTLAALQDIIKQLDKPKDQVLIEAIVISLTRTDDFQLGVELVGIDEGGLTSDSASGFGVTNWGLSTFEDTDGDLIPDINLPTNLATEGGGLVAGIFRNGGIPVMLQAIQRLNNAKIVSMPSVVTYDNEAATLESLQQQPTGTQSELSSGSLQSGFDDFVDAGVRLTVSPHISADEYLRLDVELEVSSFTGDPVGAGLPPPRVQNILKTTIALPDDHTVVMGGLISEEDTLSEAKIPLLGDIPVLGYLFKNKSRRKIKRNLFIFCTPHILRQHGIDFTELHRQTWIAKMKADELIEAVEIHNSNFKHDPRFKTPEEVDMAQLDVSSAVDAGDFYEIPPETALAEIQKLRERVAPR
jgi:general secretion pathway protein D